MPLDDYLKLLDWTGLVVSSALISVARFQRCVLRFWIVLIAAKNRGSIWCGISANASATKRDLCTPSAPSGQNAVSVVFRLQERETEPQDRV